MFDRILDETNPRYCGPLPKPRGLLPVPPEIAEEVARDQVTRQCCGRTTDSPESRLRSRVLHFRLY